MNLRQNVNAIITNSKDEVLVIRLKKGLFAGSLSFPGGGINPGEQAEIAIRRELQEETGIQLAGPITPFGYCELINKPLASHRIVLLMHATSDDQPQASSEGEAFWTPYEAIKKQLMPFAQHAYRIWKNEELTFSLIE